MAHEKMGNCPKCNALIDPMNINWVCPVCGKKNEKSSILYNCASCKFSPRLFKCPSCSEYYEGLLLIGTYSGKDRHLVRAEVVSNLFKHKYKLIDIDFRVREKIMLDELPLMGVQGLDAIYKTEFLSPFKISRFFLQTFFKDSNQVYWLHGNLYCQPGWDNVKEDANALLSMRYPAPKGNTNAQIYIIDILL
jgi:predicted RNA-binding Zn-ribbon protein involved in translation (DUF1610 family)